MLFIQFLKEIKYRLFYYILVFIMFFCVFLFFSKEILFFIVKPLLAHNGEEVFSYFIFTNMSDLLYLYLKISFLLAFIFSFPALLLQFWCFLVEGLYKYENIFLSLLFSFSFFFNYIIIKLLYNYVIPLIWSTLTGYELTSNNSLFGLYYEARITDYVDFMFSIISIFYCFLIFPVLMICLLYINFVYIISLLKIRKYIYIIFFIIGGIITPPDILSQFLIALFTIILYEVTVFGGLVFYYYKNEEIKKIL